MSGKGILLLLIGIIGIASTIFTNLVRYSNLATENFSKSYYFQTVNNIAQSGANVALREVANSPSWRSGFKNISIYGGKCTVRLVDTTFNGSSVIKITSVGMVDYKIEDNEIKGSVISDTLVVFLNKGFIPPGVKAAVTTNFPISFNGNMTVDGRDHTVDGNTVISSRGTLGIWTTQSLDQGGNCDIGGTTSSNVDYAPARPANSSSYATGQIWPGGFPTSPEGILGGADKGYPEGTLKAMAQSGINGSQYTTNPSSLTLPLRGITYVELPAGKIWKSMDITGSGILIVHNASLTAEMKNINIGTFTGMILADQMNHCHTNIIGAIVGLSPTSAGNVMGNGTGSIKYSSEAVNRATSNAFVSQPEKPSTSKVVSWIE